MIRDDRRAAMLTRDTGAERLWWADKERTWNVSTIKRYGDRYKLIHHFTSIQTPGLERPGRDPPGELQNGDAGARFASSLSRTRAAVFELAACNPWEWFCTWTLADDRGFDRWDLAPWYKNFSQWIRNQRRITGADIKYLVVPEGHKDGAVHLHALAMGLPLERLHLFTREEYLPYRILDKLKAGEKVYTWPAYQAKYGWCTLEPIKDRDRCASYIAKYVTKAMRDSAPAGALGSDKEEGFKELSFLPGAKMYYASHGLQRAKEVWRGSLDIQDDYPWSFTNEYVGIRWGKSPAEFLNEDQLKECIT